MNKRSQIFGFLTGLFIMGGVSLFAGATFSRIKTWVSGETLTASDLNAEFNNILNNLTPAGIDDYSSSVSEMRSTADPYPGSSESLATSLAGEVERLRYQILQLKLAIQPNNITYWYQDAPTAGVFSIAANGNVGVGDTTPDYTIDDAGTLGVDGQVYFSSHVTITGNLTTTAASLAVTTNVAITGDLTVSGVLASAATTKVRSTMSSDLTGNNSGSIKIVSTWTDTYDALGEMGTTTFTATSTGYYQVCFFPLVESETTVLTSSEALMYLNGAIVLRHSIEGWSGGGNFNDRSDGFCDTISLTAGDKLEFAATAVNSGGGNKFGIRNDNSYAGGNTTYGTYLTIFRVP